MYDAVIIGTGPAGLSAALTARARNMNFLLLGSKNLSSKITKAPRIDNYLGLSSVTGAEFEEAVKKQLAEAKIEITEARCSCVYSMGTYFVIDCGTTTYETRTVILAAGLSASSLLPGEEKLLGRGLSYCATCDGMLYKGKKGAVIAMSSDSANEALFLSELMSEVHYYPVVRAASLSDNEKNNIIIHSDKPIGIRGDSKVTGLITTEGESDYDVVWILRDSVMPDKLVPGLLMEDNHVKVDTEMRTNIDGLFAAGDITGRPYQFIRAAGQGNTAIHSAINYLSRKVTDNG